MTMRRDGTVTSKRAERHHLRIRAESSWSRRPGHARGRRYPASSRVIWKPYFYQTVSRGRVRGSARLPGWIRIERPGWNAYEVFMGVDATHHRSFMFLTKQTKGLGAIFFRVLLWLWRRWAYMGQFNAQDQWMIESMHALESGIRAARAIHEAPAAG